MNAVGIDVSKGKSMVAVMRPMGEVVQRPFEVTHDYESLKFLANFIANAGGNTRIVMEATGRYHEPMVAALHEMGLFVCVLNPIVIKQSGAGSVRKVKSDKKDALKIAKYGLDNWSTLREHTPMDTTRQQLKLFSRQYDMHMKTATALQNNLISLLDKTFPGANKIFDSPVRSDGHQKWVDFVMDFWHCDIISQISQESFSERYKEWCKRCGYKFSQTKANNVYEASCGHFTTLPKCENTKLLVTSAVCGLMAVMKQRAVIKNEVIRLAQHLPEYDCVLSIYGVGEITGAQLMAELGDIRNFANRGSIVAFAGIDPEVNQSGSQNKESNKSSKRGSPHLRKTLFQVVSTYLKRSPTDEAVYQFLDKKRREGKPYHVYMTAASNKFLRIYHARVKNYLNDLDNNSKI
jgi:transposase